MKHVETITDENDTFQGVVVYGYVGENFDFPKKTEILINHNIITRLEPDKHLDAGFVEFPEDLLYYKTDLEKAEKRYVKTNDMPYAYARYDEIPSASTDRRIKNVTFQAIGNEESFIDRIVDRLGFYRPQDKPSRLDIEAIKDSLTSLTFDFLDKYENDDDFRESVLVQYFSEFVDSMRHQK